MDEKLRERFDRSITKLGIDDHWHWTGYRDSQKRACIRMRANDGREIKIYATRLAWLVYRDTEPIGEACWRICLDYDCYNPYHMMTGGYGQEHRWNAEHGLRSHKGNPVCDPDAVWKDLLAGIKTAEISQRHGVSRQEISQIRHGKRFRGCGNLSNYAPVRTDES